ncbi:uncharacterized protein BX664DRAFT_388878 [Halteromyces radiatus]|uniref:uncharacterized protein n=1 Tax=Halteromyces radiatus TaxID=101107 RepID=UPI002220053E|nr:uncharacterized protein BX664DRAFT_388878 [Halteromyces radiatus]KAI8079920.1 hypothetical protein BX664DRAFT_388878 [Halteromyces radiatus]
MDWDRIEALFSPSRSSIDLIDHISFLLDFFDTLFKDLTRCSSVTQCTSLYPRAGPLLTKVAIHPYVGCQVKLAQLVVNCIIEYTKYDMEDTSKSNTKSSTWCIQRLRRISPTTQPILLSSPQAFEQHIHTKIIPLLHQHLHNGTLSISKLHKLCDLAIVGWEQASMIDVVEGLIDAAIQLDQQDQNIKYLPIEKRTSKSYLSPRFIQHAINNKKQYEKWPLKLKTKLWQAVPDIFECEWLDWIDLHLDVHKEEEEEEEEEEKDEFLQGLRHCPSLVQRSFCLMARWVSQDVADWRMVRLFWIKMAELVHVLDLPENMLHMQHKKEGDLLAPFHATFGFIYTGSPFTLVERRNQAWLFCLIMPCYMTRCIDTWFSWCMDPLSLWSDKMDDLSTYMAWLICPTLDDRMTVCCCQLKQWIQSLKGYPSSGIHSFLNHWYDLFHGHVQVIVRVLVVMIQYEENHQWKSMLDRFMDDAKSLHVERVLMMTLLDRLNETIDDDDEKINYMKKYVYSKLDRS